MNQITKLAKIRETILKTLEDVSLTDANKIAAGFNNNIAWNLGNIIVSQQNVLYKCAGCSLDIDEKYFPLYKAGTKPKQDITDEEFISLKNIFKAQTQKMLADYEKNIFANYKAWHHAMTGIDIDSADSAIAFLLFHESLHLGYIMALKRAIA